MNDPHAPLRVVHLQRLPSLIHFSIERLFSSVREHLPPDVQIRTWECPRDSGGWANRLRNVLSARRVRGDVLHVTGDVGYLALGLRHPIVLTVHDLVLLHRLDGWRKTIGRKLWFDWPCRRATIVTTVSESTRQELLAATGCNPDKVVVVHNPLIRHVEASHRPMQSRPRILQIGSAWNKNFVRQAEALAGIPCVLDFVGLLSPEHRDALVRHGIEFTVSYGLDDDEMAARFVECDILMFVSTYEGFGLPIIEAQATGRPVVTATTSSMPEVAGEGACLVDPFNVESIRAGLLRIINDESYRDSVIEAGYRNVRRFQPDRIAAQYAAVYRATLR